MTNRPTPRTTNPPRIHYSYSLLFRAELCPYRLSCINVTSFRCTTTCQNCPEGFLKACSRPQAFPSRRSTVSISSMGTRVPHPACSTVVAPPCRASLPVHPFHPLDSSPSLPRSSLHRPGISTVETVLPPGEVPGVALGAVPVLTLVLLHTRMSHLRPWDPTAEALSSPSKVPGGALVAVPVATCGRVPHPRRDRRRYWDRLHPPTRATAIWRSPRVVSR